MDGVRALSGKTSSRKQPQQPAANAPALTWHQGGPPPVVFADGVATYGIHSGVVHTTLAQKHILLTEDGTVREELSSVLGLRLTLAGARSLRDALDKMILAAQSAPATPH
jgi:hypothetical protein